VSAQDGNALFSVLPQAGSLSIRTGISKNGEEYAWPGLYQSSAIRIGRPKDGGLPPATGGGGGGPPPVTVYYRLAAVDTGVGRRAWNSTALDLSQAPSPVGSWVGSTLTRLYQWQ
jgi:hypothetical protein